MARFIFVTGTDTGVGKTVLAAALTRWLRAHGRAAVALKPLTSGDREDARRLEAAQDGALALDWINPWCFTQPLSPLLAARRDGRKVTVKALIGHLQATAALGDPVIIEGAGGLLSPLTEGADAPEIIAALRARPVVVAQNRLGVINQVRLVLKALPASARRFAQVVLMESGGRDPSSQTNRGLLEEYVAASQVHVCPRWSPGQRDRIPSGDAELMFARLAAQLGIDEDFPSRK